MALANGNNRGSGYYGREPGRTSNCVNAQNPYGHNKECACGWWRDTRASQITPYVDDFPESQWGEDLDDIDHDSNAWREAANNDIEAEMDRQMGRGL